MKETIVKLHEYKENLNDLIFATDMQLEEMDPDSSDEDRLISWYSGGTITAYKTIQKNIEKEIGYLCSNIKDPAFDLKKHLFSIALFFHQTRTTLLDALKDAQTEKEKRFTRGQIDCYQDMLVSYLKSFARELNVGENTGPDWVTPYKPYFT